MKHAMGAVVALALGIGLAVSAQANGINRQSATSPNMQSGSTQQMQQRVRPQRQAVRQLRHKRIASIHKAGKTRMAAVGRHNRTKLARLHQKAGKTRIATLHRQKQNQAIGVGSSMPNNGSNNMNGNATITPTTPNSAGGNQNLNNNTQPPQNK